MHPSRIPKVHPRQLGLEHTRDRAGPHPAPSAETKDRVPTVSDAGVEILAPLGHPEEVEPGSTPNAQLPERADEAVPAGFPSPAQGYYSGPVDLNRHLINDPAATFIVRVSGDSMIGAGIFDGDEIIVDRSLEPHDGNVVIAVVDGELTVKRLRFEHGRVRLAPENPAYADIVLEELSELTVWGVVTRCLHRV